MDCFKETVIRLVSLLTWMREGREKAKFHWESQKRNILKIHFIKLLAYINNVSANRLANLVNFRQTGSSVISSLHEKQNGDNSAAFIDHIVQCVQIKETIVKVINLLQEVYTLFLGENPVKRPR